MNNISANALGLQLMKPTGEAGLTVANNMNATNGEIYDFVVSNMSIKDNDKVLEIGFGNGKFIDKFFDLNPTITFFGVDFSETMCIEAKKFNTPLIDGNKLHISCQDSLSLSFADDVFDIIVTINTIYFWNNPDAQLKEINRILRKGGQLVIGYRPEKTMKNLPFTQEVFKHYDPRKFRATIERLGFVTTNEYARTSTVKAVDGSIVQIEDICLIAEKMD